MPRVIAHRGASRKAAENTVAAFRLAIELGADGVELDVRRTADDVLVIHHDPQLAGGRLIRRLRASELPPAVPTLDQALDACAALPADRWAVNVEIKNDPAEGDFDPSDEIAEATIAALIARRTPNRWLISSFRWEVIDRCRQLAPAIRTAWLCVDVPEGTIDRLVAAGHQALHPWYGAVTAELAAACSQRGIELNVWTCDDPAAMVELARWGIDGICTNVPDVALEVLGASRGD